MVFDCWKSPEGVKEYKNIGQPYPDHLFDRDFEYFTDLIAWDPNKKSYITEIRRLKRFDDSEYLIYGEYYEGHDKVYGRKHQRHRSTLGAYMKIEREVVRIPNEDVVKNPTMGMEFDSRGNVTSGSSISMFKEVAGPYQRFRDADFKTLFDYGCIPTKEEKQKIDLRHERLYQA